MSDTPKPPAPERKPDTPPSVKPDHVLDSIFRHDGPMPPARLGIRSFAFLLDVILVGTLSAFIIWNFVIPGTYPEAPEAYMQFSEEINEWFLGGRLQSEPIPTPGRKLAETISRAQEVLIACCWIYFALGEAFLAGSLGKRACRLITVSTVVIAPPPVLTGIIRGGIKTAAIFILPPFSLIVTIAMLFTNKRRQMGHDILSRTAVVDEKQLPATDGRLQT